MALVLDQIKKKYGTIDALRGISVALKAGEVVGLLGPNGAGKSTLMKILTGSVEKWDGTITYKGADLRDSLKSIQQRTGYLPENNPLYEELYVLEYLQFTASLYKIKNPPLASIIEQVGLTEFKNRKIETLSKGYHGGAFRANGLEFFIPLEGKIDVEKERLKLQEELKYANGFLLSVQKKLANERFVSNAPDQVLANERKKEADALEKIEVIEKSLAAL